MLKLLYPQSMLLSNQSQESEKFKVFQVRVRYNCNCNCKQTQTWHLDCAHHQSMKLHSCDRCIKNIYACHIPSCQCKPSPNFLVNIWPIVHLKICFYDSFSYRHITQSTVIHTLLSKKVICCVIIYMIVSFFTPDNSCSTAVVLLWMVFIFSPRSPKKSRQVCQRNNLALYKELMHTLQQSRAISCLQDLANNHFNVKH